MGQVQDGGLRANKEIRQHGRFSFSRMMLAKGLSRPPGRGKIQVNAREGFQSVIHCLACPRPSANSA